MENDNINVTGQVNMATDTVNIANNNDINTTEANNVVNNMENINYENQAKANLAKVSVWTKIRNTLLYEVKLELTPKQEKVFGEVRDFWRQDIKEISKESVMQLFTFKK